MTVSQSDTPPDSRLRAAVLHPHSHWEKEARLRTAEAALEEAVSLAGAINLDVRVAELVRVDRPNAATFLGSGTVERFGKMYAEQDVKLVIMDHPLSPVQQRNLEREWGLKVIDRTGLILEIFGERAQTHEGRLQVELASLNFQRSRLVRSWTHLERQRGGFGFLGGPGESQLEMDRRIIQDRIKKIEEEIAKVKQTRSQQREARVSAGQPIVALVGYTNAGKSTLFNALTTADVLAKDMLFATLDPIIRPFKLPSGKTCLISDTVGFISNLPTQLIAAFRATLEEVNQADIILHVRDIASPSTDAEKYDVEMTLSELGIDPHGDRRIIEVLNKIDRLSQEDAQHMVKDAARAQVPTVALSAITGEGVGNLLELIDRQLAARHNVLKLTLPADAGEVIAWLYRHGQVLERSELENGMTELSVALSEADRGRYEARYGENYGREG